MKFCNTRAAANLAVFLLPALAVSVPSGYSYGMALLLLTSLAGSRVWWGQRLVPAETGWLYASFGLMAISLMADAALSQTGPSGFDRPLKILLTLPCLLYLVRRPPQTRWLWAGLVAGALSACVLALYQLISQHPDVVASGRTSGFTHPIQFGDIALLLGLLCLCGWRLPQRSPRAWRLWLTAGFLAGLLTSLLSGSRGGWLSLGLMAVAFVLYLTKRGHLRALLVTLLALTIVSLALLQLPQLGLQARVQEAWSEVIGYQQKGRADTSIGARLQMWQFASTLYRQKPLWGWTQKGYQQQVRDQVAAHRLDPALLAFSQPHNEMLDAAAKRGTAGLLALWSIYLTPLLLFARCLGQSSSVELRAVCLAGMLVPVACFGFGLTQGFLLHNNGTIVYFYLLTVLWSMACGLRHQPGCGLCLASPAFAGQRAP